MKKNILFKMAIVLSISIIIFFVCFFTIRPQEFGGGYIDPGEKYSPSEKNQNITQKSENPSRKIRSRNLENFTNTAQEKISKILREINDIDFSQEREMMQEAEDRGKICTLMELYALHDPEEGFRWLTSSPKIGEEIRLAINTFSIKLIENDPKLWHNMLNRMGKGFDRDIFLSGIVSLSGADPQQIWQEYESIKYLASDPGSISKKIYSSLAAINPANFYDQAVKLSLQDGENFSLEIFFENAKFNSESDAVDFLSKESRSDSNKYFDIYTKRLPIEKSMEFADAMKNSNIDPSIKDGQIDYMFDRYFMTDALECAKRINLFSDSSLKTYWEKRLRNFVKYKNDALKLNVEKFLTHENN